MRCCRALVKWLQEQTVNIQIYNGMSLNIMEGMKIAWKSDMNDEML